MGRHHSGNREKHSTIQAAGSNTRIDIRLFRFAGYTFAIASRTATHGHRWRFATGKLKESPQGLCQVSPSMQKIPPNSWLSDSVRTAIVAQKGNLNQCRKIHCTAVTIQSVKALLSVVLSIEGPLHSAPQTRCLLRTRNAGPPPPTTFGAAGPSNPT